MKSLKRFKYFKVNVKIIGPLMFPEVHFLDARIASLDF